ncbi:hypothetical protein K1719_028905 [Acacia pycnantha]|nr:hypothetical protein K1719_028905 [Acacia pycnantha]
MTTGLLEVLLVYAKGIKRNHLIGKPSYYVILECGTQSQRSKISSGKNDKTWWNEKFTFEFSSFDDSIKKLRHLKCTIMDTQLLTNGGFVGESRIYIRRIISEGTEKGYIEIKPAPYNVVLEDDTYKGQIKIGFKLFLSKEKQEIDEAGESNAREKEKEIHIPPQSN